MSHRFTPALAAVLVTLASSAARAQATFDVYVALGDSLTAGVVSGSLVETHQRNSFPAQIARAAGTSFSSYRLGRAARADLIGLSRPIVVPKASKPGSPTNAALARPYHNLGVPGADTQDILATVTDGGGPHDLVLRGRGTALQQAATLRPTLITLWVGNNDVLGAALTGRAIEGATITSVAR
jgi:lysophospholipase L1-like esterase